MFHGVARKDGRGVPGCLRQAEVTGKMEKAKVRWTLKVAHLKGDSNIPGLVALSLYNTKPFYFITNTCEKIKLQKKARSVWHKGLQCMVKMQFYRLNIIDAYNFGMNNVDQVDQLQNSHCWDRFIVSSGIVLRSFGILGF